jgi:uncharacterized membrane protein YphA (DoxX/SURF4 family)
MTVTRSNRRPRFQFGLGTALVVTALAAVASMIASTLNPIFFLVGFAIAAVALVFVGFGLLAWFAWLITPNDPPLDEPPTPRS